MYHILDVNHEIKVHDRELDIKNDEFQFQLAVKQCCHTCKRTSTFEIRLSTVWQIFKLMANAFS